MEKFNREENDFSKKETKFEKEVKKEITLPYTIKLAEPIKLSEKSPEITEITFHNKFCIGMIQHFPMDQEKHALKMGHFLPVIEDMTGEVSQVVAKLSFDDFAKCSEVVSHFLPNSREDGE